MLTLIGPAAASALAESWVAAVGRRLRAEGAALAAADWLAPGAACDLPFDGLPGPRARALAAEVLAGKPVDLAVQPRAGRRKALLLADMESTVIAQEMLDELGAELGLGGEIASITARTMAGALDFAESLKTRVALLAGAEASVLSKLRDAMTLDPGAVTLVRTLRAAGVHTVLVSGGFSDFAEPVAAACGFDEVRANRLVVDAGRLTGAVAEPILGPDAKRAALAEISAKMGLPEAAACAVGDGANDAAMLGAAGLGVAYRGKPPARAAADAALDHADLTGILHLQGYRMSEFESPAV